MTERTKDLLVLAALAVLLVITFAKILFTDQIIRAPDIINEFYWGVKDAGTQSFWELLRFNARATWDLYVNSGFTTEGGTVSQQFLYLFRLVFWLVPAPASVAWYLVIHLFIGAAGLYCYCRLLGLVPLAALLAAMVFALAPENASLINAGHVMKVATISLAPWAFYCFEKGYRSGRLFWFLATGFTLAYQFFHTHWQIAFYTCLGIAVYGLIRFAGVALEQRQCGLRAVARLAGRNLLVPAFFLTTVAISLLPLATWSQGTNRGIESGANQGKGGLAMDEAMSWSLPPEELATFVIPGFFGFSRQEAGPNPDNIAAYYWGRMNFTQTSDYLGLLPWLLLPLPLMFRRDRYTWIALTGVLLGVLFSMGKYTPFYRLLYEYLPGINHFRVPKMMMFLPVCAMAVLSAQGFQLLLDPSVRQTSLFRRYLLGLFCLPLAIAALLGVILVGKEHWVTTYGEILSQPTRYQQGVELVIQRWNNLVLETGIAAGCATLYGLLCLCLQRSWLPVRLLPYLFLALYLLDVGRVNAKFQFLVELPKRPVGSSTPAMTYLQAHGSSQYRVLPMDGSDPMSYAVNRIPVMFTANAVQQQRWQNYLDNFSFQSSMPDMINLKYLVLGSAQYEREKGQLGEKFVPVFRSPDGGEVVLENRAVLPKAWLVAAVGQLQDPGQVVTLLRDPRFDPRRAALVESPPPFVMADPNAPPSDAAGRVTVTHYTGERIELVAEASRNALLVLGEKYYRGWRAAVNGKTVEIVPVNHILRGIYLSPGRYRVDMAFDPVPYRIGVWLTFASFVLFAVMVVREIWMLRSRRQRAS